MFLCGWGQMNKICTLSIGCIYARLFYSMVLKSFGETKKSNARLTNAAVSSRKLAITQARVVHTLSTVIAVRGTLGCKISRQTESPSDQTKNKILNHPAFFPTHR
jgi:hypothetical protein